MSTHLPRHIAIIMDGNGRWAKARSLPSLMGHKEGVKSLKAIVKYCVNEGIKILTVYAFSTENWKRPKLEVDALMMLIEREVAKELETFKANEIRVNCIGRLHELPESVKKKLNLIMDETKQFSKLIFNVALNYGSRGEIVDAVNAIVKDGKGNIDEKDFGNYLYTRGLPDPDLLIRTSGEMRISNFLLWQISYSELYFTDKLWPDFKEKDLEEAIEKYQTRERRFGAKEKVR